MIWRGFAAILAALWLIGAQVMSMGYDGALFVGAARDSNTEKALELLAARGQSIVNAKDSAGDTALVIAAGRRDDRWTGWLLTNGADPNLANKSGETPLIAAARIGYLTGAEWLISKGAKVDQDNKMGETPLIVAVRQRQAPLVKYLLSKGADPDKADFAAGYSARDYAKRDTRNPEILRLIEESKAKKAAAAK